MRKSGVITSKVCKDFPGAKVFADFRGKSLQTLEVITLQTTTKIAFNRHKLVIMRKYILKEAYCIFQVVIR